MLDRFPDYWDKDRIHIDRITYFPIPDSTVRLANLRAGALDLIERLLPTDIPSVRGDPKLKLLLPTPPIAYTGLTINLANTDRAKNPLGQNAKVRQALELTHRPRRHQPGRLQRRVHAGQSMVGADQSSITSRNSRSRSATSRRRRR